jgi:hypothetical protein
MSYIEVFEQASKELVSYYRATQNTGEQRNQATFLSCITAVIIAIKDVIKNEITPQDNKSIGFIEGIIEFLGRVADDCQRIK